MFKIFSIICYFYAFFCVPLYGVKEPHIKTRIVNFGVLSYRPKEQTLSQWNSLEQIIEKSVDNLKFNVKVYTLDELNIAVKNKEIDFVLTNPAHNVFLRNKYNLTYPVATTPVILEIKKQFIEDERLNEKMHINVENVGRSGAFFSAMVKI